MSRFMMPLAFLAVALFALTGSALAEGDAEKGAEGDAEKGADAEKVVEHGFIGPDGCKMCHKSEKSGNQYGKWLESAHAKAFETLASDEAKAAATEAGLEGNPQELAECLRCHVTAHDAKAELLGKKYTAEQGVGCESCHGAGADYKKKKIMQDHDAAVAAGLNVPTAETCTACHNEESPTYKEFDFEKMMAQIAHPTPEAESK